jgi:hypothetical protein
MWPPDRLVSDEVHVILRSSLLSSGRLECASGEGVSPGPKDRLSDEKSTQYSRSYGALETTSFIASGRMDTPRLFLSALSFSLEQLLHTCNLPFHPIVFSLGDMINGSNTTVFASWKRVMTRGKYNLMIKRLSLCLLQARVGSFEL